ncbi:MAG: CHASE2 domain-containing protein [Pseudanabaenaceae cyanobacterium SKYGB_i_bin29]|nr:CHASE2 domain-containing protein [Pseudanabaenaceae cyanobacterium SKYG29]MDW8421655.1 CHASE2 domain-containing protein [Pseudanabaenaceae cyanobacterium SKYGB_i_bin29]
MVKYINLELTGQVLDGYAVRCEVGEIKNSVLQRQGVVTGKLPSPAEICATHKRWQILHSYVSHSLLKIRCQDEITINNGGNLDTSIRELDTISVELKQGINRWLQADYFQEINDYLLSYFHDQDEIIFTLTTEDQQIQTLPLHLWEFFDNYSHATFSLGYHSPSLSVSTDDNTGRLLVIIGHNGHTGGSADRQVLEKFMGSNLCYLEEPTTKALIEVLNTQNFAAIYFADYNFHPIDKGYLRLNQTEIIPIKNFKSMLKQQVHQRLKLAIINSYNAVELARELTTLGLGQIVAMIHPLPGYINHQFLGHFLEEFYNHNSLCLSVRRAREKLTAWQVHFPYISWLPIIWQNSLLIGKFLFWKHIFPPPPFSLNVTLPDRDEEETLLMAVDPAIGILESRGYKVLGVLGQGGFGKTYRAVQSDGRFVAIKQLLFREGKDKQALVERFLKEANVLQKLGSHPQIPSFYGCFWEGDNYFIVQEFIEGITLDQELAQATKFSEDYVKQLVEDVLNVLSFVHSNNFIHRDVKPQNLIRRSSDQKIVLIDFGVVKENVGTNLNLSIRVGTPKYMPVEQYYNNPVFASDIFALGIVAIECLNGLTILSDNLEPASLAQRLSISEGFASFLLKCIADKAADRYKDAKTALLALQSLDNQPPTFAKTTVALPKPHPLTSIKSLLPLVLSTFAVLAVRYVGLLQGVELFAYDLLLRIRPGEFPDERLVFITIDDKDLSFQDEKGWQRRGSIADAALELTIRKLNALGAQTIGLDIYRDGEPDTGTITNLYASQSNLIGVCKVADPEIDVPEIPPPTGLRKEQVGFSDVPDDNDIVRRQLVFMTPPKLEGKCVASLGFATQVALHYLRSKGVSPAVEGGLIRIGGVKLFPLESHSGGYQRVDMRGHQILLNYRAVDAVQSFGYRSNRSVQNLAPSLSLRDFLNEEIPPERIKGKIILIGVTSTSSDDYWQTPISKGRVAGLYIQGQMVSQLVSAVLDGRTLLRPLPFWQDYLWMFVGAGIGCIIYRISRTRVIFLGTTLAGCLALFIVYFLLFAKGLWIPFVPTIVSMILAQGGTHLLSYSTKIAHNRNRL